MYIYGILSIKKVFRDNIRQKYLMRRKKNTVQISLDDHF